MPSGSASAAGIDAVHVPFKGTPEVVNELMAGRIDYFFCPVNVCLPLDRDKRVTALAMGSSRRSAALPELPTTVELGVPDSDYDFWVGLFVPAETPRDNRRAAVPRERRGRSRILPSRRAWPGSAPSRT